jgi:uncharacterized membrane protein
VTRSQRLLSGLFLASGALHLVRPAPYRRIVPHWLPAHREIVLLSGVAELAGGAGVLSARTRRGAGLWLAAVLVAVLPANVDMALHPERHRRIPPALLRARLVLQPALVVWVLRATSGRRRRGT